MMPIYTKILFVCILLSFVSCKKKGPPTDLVQESIIPKPVSITSSGNRFLVLAETSIFIDGNNEVAAVGNYLAERLRPSTGFPLKVIPSNETSVGIFMTTKGASADLGTEGYELTITEDLLTLRSPTAAGLFRGIQTIRQILPPAVERTTIQNVSWEIPTGVIMDYPQYSWRGSMLDVARHFFSVDDVKRYIDLISYYKMNVLHLHLSDDQGWRIEIKSWPNLTKIGAVTQVGGGKGGFYTQEQYADLVSYAQSRYITLVPEIDLPGHINAALASYGELNGGTIVPDEGRVSHESDNILGSKNKPTELYTGTNVGWSTLRVEKEITFRFVNDVIRELSSLTPGPWLHIGGDEADATKKKDYITFINRFVEILRANNKRMIGWEEIAQANIDSTVITHHWKLKKYALMGIEKGSKLIMSPASKTYLDMQYDSTTRLGQNWAAYIEVDSAYQWNPTTQLPGISSENILGVEAPLWTETITNMDEIEYMVFPRLPGYAEIGWSKEAGRGWDEYKIRLGRHGPRMKAMMIDYYPSKLVPWVE